MFVLDHNYLSAVAAALEHAAPSSAPSGFSDHDQPAESCTGLVMNAALRAEFIVVTAARHDPAIDQTIGANFFPSATSAFAQPIRVLAHPSAAQAKNAQATESTSCEIVEHGFLY